MTNRILLVVLFLAGAFSLPITAQDFPSKPDRLVNDYTQTLTASQVQQLEQKLVAFDDSTSIQIAVVVMNSTGRYNIADYGVRLAQQWGVGGQDNDTGILLLVALGDRAVTIQTGYGIEGAVPDAIAYRIIENEIKPAFRQENYFLGIQAATDALIAYTKGEYKAEPRRDRSDSGGIAGIIFLVVIIMVIIAIIGKGGGNGGSGEVMGRRGAETLWWMTMLGGMGQGGRGGFGRGGGFGGGFGGGGFGGFGGGGFGGGGASGRW